MIFSENRCPLFFPDHALGKRVLSKVFQIAKVLQIAKVFQIAT